ncbi:hypothetical protein GON04_15535 [Ramlibacter sp. MAH-25]|uniref:Uncharacterized protein n=1 Tax=Ramlibacter pinisoli TaxID=2682844 RepID=A0A6N8IW23_9BURK|nr:hypothetical protein [Ramlibacter sp. CGMCC 1.13660]MBA2960926.1 hypothetical protein [Ramlibacter sp. CGMCC 1.13660]MVQ30872.1 hypothetical protein [Ramlibacter pinisoli]
MDPEFAPLPAPFSLVAGGPLFQLLRRSHLSDNSLHLLQRRVICITLIAWLPLLVLAVAEGRALPGSVDVPFLLDIEAQVRFLVVLPLLIAAEWLAHRRMSLWIAQFTERGLVPPAGMQQFQHAIASAMRWRNSVAVELALLAVVVLAGASLVPHHFAADEGTTWRQADGGLSAAGLWLRAVAMPLVQFLILRWYFRLAVWTRFLWQVSRIDLDLLPTHPDGAGGLGFLAALLDGFAAVIVAHATLLSARIAQQIFYAEATLPEFVPEIGLLTALVMLVFLGPLMLFVPQLARTQRVGLAQYGSLASRYVREFDLKWVHGRTDPGEPLVGSADIQSLADLAGSYDIVRGMRVALVSTTSVLRLLLYTLVPFLPLLLTMMPLDELLKSLVKLLL